MEFDSKRQLLSNQLGALRLDSFCFFCVDDYLPENLYEALRESCHGVPPVACPDKLARKAFMINVKRPKWSKRNQI
jgi:hypothetical protein